MLATLTSAVPYIFRSLVQSLADLNLETFSIGGTVTQKSFTLTPLYENLLDVVYSTMTYGVGHGVDPSSGSLIQCVFTKSQNTMIQSDVIILIAIDLDSFRQNSAI